MAALRTEPNGIAKSDHAKKQEILKELQLLRIKEQNLEREKSTHIYDRRSDLHAELSAVQQLEQTMAANHKSNRTKMKQQLSKTKDAVRKFQQELERLQQISPTPETVERLKMLMEDVEGQISTVREQQKLEFDELTRDERLFGQEVEALDRRFDAWSLPGGGTDGAVEAPRTHRPASLPSSRDIIADLPPEVAAFEIFLQQTGGHRGGWDEYDHSTFLKYRNRHKGKLTFLGELTDGGLIPTRTDKEIRDHEAWYQEYTQRNDCKKEAIQKWRERKEIERDEALAKAAKSEVEKKAETPEEEERRKQAAEREKQEQLERLSRWKVEKELQKAQEEEQRLKQQLEKRRQLELEKRRKSEVKQKVNKYKMVKEREDEERRRFEMERQQQEAEERRMQATELTTRYRDRDLEAVREKRDRDRHEKERLELEKQQRLDKLRSQVEVFVERDPQRLLRPTEGWIERQRDVGPSGAGPLLHMPHKAVPTWRQGLR